MKKYSKLLITFGILYSVGLFLGAVTGMLMDGVWHYSRTLVFFDNLFPTSLMEPIYWLHYFIIVVSAVMLIQNIINKWIRAIFTLVHNIIWPYVSLATISSGGGSFFHPASIIIFMNIFITCFFIISLFFKKKV